MRLKACSDLVNFWSEVVSESSDTQTAEDRVKELETALHNSPCSCRVSTFQHSVPGATEFTMVHVCDRCRVLGLKTEESLRKEASD